MTGLQYGLLFVGFVAITGASAAGARAADTTIAVTDPNSGLTTCYRLHSDQASDVHASDRAQTASAVASDVNAILIGIENAIATGIGGQEPADRSTQP